VGWRKIILEIDAKIGGIIFSKNNFFWYGKNKKYWFKIIFLAFAQPYFVEKTNHLIKRCHTI